MKEFTELDPADYPRVAVLLEGLAERHGSVPAVLAGAAPGRVRVDDIASPRAVLLDGPEGLYLGGAPFAELDWAALRGAIHPFAYLYPDDVWLPVIDRVLPHRFMRRHQRVTLSLDLSAVASRPPPSADRFALRPMADGVGAEVVDDDVVVAHCREDMVVGDRVEVGIWTDPRFRRQGLARLAVAGAIAVAQRRGLKRMGWHCLASNAGSLYVAQRSGFAIVAEYEAFGAYLDAENLNDLETSQWLDLAAHFAAAAAELPTLGICAAQAFSCAGRPDDALAALERLVETNWTGRAGWLEQNWALAPLHNDPRFERVIARRRQAEGGTAR